MCANKITSKNEDPILRLQVFQTPIDEIQHKIFAHANMKFK